MRKLAQLLLVISLCFGWLSCATSRSIDGFNPGGGGGGGNGTFQAGNWAFTTSGGINGAIYMGGQLNVSNSTVSGKLTIVGTTGSGFLIGPTATPMSVTGTLSSGTLTLTGAAASSNITMTFTGLSTTGTITSLPSGTYTVTGGTDNGDSGSISGTLASSISGTWAGTDAVTGGTVTASFTESATPDSASGRFFLTSSGSGVTFVGAAGCTVTGTLNTDSFAAGGIVVLDVTTADNGVPGHLVIAGVVNNPTTPTTITNGAFYLYSGGSGCMLRNTGTAVGFTMTKQ